LHFPRRIATSVHNQPLLPLEERIELIRAATIGNRCEDGGWSPRIPLR
jgi:hypothetical protein